MSKHDEYLNTANDECVAELEAVKEKMDNTVEPTVEQFQRNTLDNIPQQFGDFLYTALGDRVTGQRSSVLNDKYIAENSKAVALKERADIAGCTIEEQVVKEQAKYDAEYRTAPSYMKRWNNHVQPQLWLTAGRKFGVSYITGNGKRHHTIYFGAGECFAHLTQGHVDCIKNRQKRECTQSFLNFRDNYVEGIAGLQNQIIPVSVPVELGVVSCVTKAAKINSDAGGYRDTTKQSFHVMDGTVQDTITHVIATVNSVDVWDQISDVNSRDVSKAQVIEPSYISLTFLKIDDAEHRMTALGNIDMSVKNVRSSLENSTNFRMREVLNHLGEVDVDVDTYRYPRQKVFRQTPYAAYKMKDADGVLLNMHDVIQHPAIKAELDKRVEFYTTMSDRLQRMKHENATLYFVNADI